MMSADFGDEGGEDKATQLKAARWEAAAPQRGVALFIAGPHAQANKMRGAAKRLDRQTGPRAAAKEEEKRGCRWQATI